MIFTPLFPVFFALYDKEKNSWVLSGLILLAIIFIIMVTTSTFSVYQPSHAELKKLSKEELSEVSAEGLFNFVQETGSITSGIGNTDITFARMEINGDLRIDALISNFRLGVYNDNWIDGSEGFAQSTGDLEGCFTCGNASESDGRSADQVINGLEIVANDGSGPALIQDPYLEGAFRDTDNDGDAEEMVGLRLGARNINANMGFDLTVTSGSIWASALGIDTRVSGHRLRRTDNSVYLLNNPQVGDLTDTLNFNGTKDFWLSVQKEELIWEHRNPLQCGGCGERDGDTNFHTDTPGFYLHMSDDLTANVFG